MWSCSKADIHRYELARSISASSSTPTGSRFLYNWDAGYVCLHFTFIKNVVGSPEDWLAGEIKCELQHSMLICPFSLPVQASLVKLQYFGHHFCKHASIVISVLHPPNPSENYHLSFKPCSAAEKRPISALKVQKKKKKGCSRTTKHLSFTSCSERFADFS